MTRIPWGLASSTLTLCLLLTIVCGSLTASDRPRELPVRVVKVTMVADALPAVLKQLGRFADENAFAFRAGQSSPDETHILVQLWRDDIKGVGVNTSDPKTADITYSIFLYRNCNDAVPESAFDDVGGRLRDMLSTIEGMISVDVNSGH